jgi:hypothetical protein
VLALDRGAIHHAEVGVTAHGAVNRLPVAFAHLLPVVIAQCAQLVAVAAFPVGICDANVAHRAVMARLPAPQAT